MIVIEDDGCEDFHAMDGDVSQGRKESKGGKCSSNAAIVVEPRRTLGFSRQVVLLDKCVTAAFGASKATILQQLTFDMYISKRDNRHCYDGRVWVYNTYSEWVEQIPWMSVPTVKKHFIEHERQGIVLSRQPHGGDRTKYYTIDYQMLDSEIERRAQKNPKIRELIVDRQKVKASPEQ